MSFFKPMTLKRQLTMGFSLMIGIVALVVFLNIIYVHSALELLSHRITDLRTPIVNHSMVMLNGVNQILTSLRNWMLLGQGTYREEKNEIWSKRFEVPLWEMKKMSVNWNYSENMKQFQEIESFLSRFKQFLTDIEDIVQTSDNIPTLKMFFEQAIPQSNMMLSHITKMIDLEHQEKANPARKVLLDMMTEVRDTLSLSQANVHAFLLSGQPQFQTNFEALWTQKIVTRFDELKNQTALLTPEQLKMFELFSQTRHTFFNLISQILEKRKQPDWNLSYYWLTTKAEPLGNQLSAIFQDMVIYQQQLLQHEGHEIDQLIHKLTQLEWYLLGIGIVLAGFLGWFMSDRILKQIGGEPAEIAKMITQMAKGNLDFSFQSNQKVVTGICACVQELVEALKKLGKQARKLAQGDYSIQIIPHSEKDMLSQALVDLANRLQQDITPISEAIVAGNYNYQIENKGENDLLGNALNKMIQKLQQVTSESIKLDWLKTGQTELNEKMRGEQDPTVLTQHVLNYLANYLNAQVGVFFLAEEECFKLVSSYAYKPHSSHNEFKLGEGLIGQAALEKKSIRFTHNIKELIHLSINSGMGESSPHDIFVLPLIYEQQVLGVLELASSRHFTSTEIELLNRVADNIAISLNSAQSRLRMQALLENSQQLTLDLQNQQQEIMESEEQIRAIVDTVIDAIITINEFGIIESYNPAAEEIFGHPWSEVIGSNVNILMPEPHRSQHDQYLQQYLTTGHAKIMGKRHELTGQHQNGSIFPIDIAINEMLVGEKCLFIGIIRDITAQKKTEKALQVQQEELHSTNEELQAQQEELAANNEKLQTQQEELKATNVELEEKSNALERSQQELEEKAHTLERSTQYKSEFLAHMSHELRTPLNSLLILAQLLSNNKEGNLSNKQVEYARTIHSAASDLLALLNDILDLSKVEAGKMEIHAEEVSLADLVEAIEQKFRHVAENKGLAFPITMASNLPHKLHTDVQRVKQIINNLLSNAFKFTSEGAIKLTIQRPTTEVEVDFSNQAILKQNGKNLMDPAKTIAISVADTGIGIPIAKQQVIFEAFRQTDSTTSKRFGGTGLGLSISLQFAHLLGGKIQLSSEEGKGSIFTLYLPETMPVSDEESISWPSISTKASVSQPTKVDFLDDSSVEPLDSHSVAVEILGDNASGTEPLSDSFVFQEKIIDDRDFLTPKDKSILIIEDDLQFSNILMELAREKNFKCLFAVDGKIGLQLAEKYKPNAIILDVGLPQMDGWTVMEKLKENPETRHIPVHFISGADHRQNAKKMGAIGYLLKPISMDELGNAFKKIERFIEQTVKKLLVIADDEPHQQKISALVSSNEVQTIFAKTVVEASQHLQITSFDSIILDVEIEQGTGIKWLEQLQHEENLTQIPVIIYANRELLPEEEAILQRCENNLTIKAVRSPERLLGEATLFLHQVEANLPSAQRNMLQMLHDKEAILHHKKVLIVDDDMRNTFALATLLEDKEMEVIAGKNGLEALALLAEEEHKDVDIILMDIMMPEMDGYKAMEKIRAQSHYRKIPIIALTAKAMKGDKAKCIEAGANDYLSKPVDTDKLLSLMRVWLYR